MYWRDRCDDLYWILPHECGVQVGLQYALYGSTMHVATLQPYPQASFLALQCCTLKACFQCTTLLIGHGMQGDKAMNLAVLCGDFRTIFVFCFFFCSMCRSLREKKKWNIEIKCGFELIYSSFTVMNIMSNPPDATAANTEITVVWHNLQQILLCSGTNHRTNLWSLTIPDLPGSCH